MKPKSLVISAWGPYAGQVHIDFDQVSQEGMFLITGPTGAGKTTIFDAISYALYGQVSGKVRERDSLRSDFATIDTDTWVDLTFSHKGEEYRIIRQPRYLRPKKRGTGEIVANEQARLYLPDAAVLTQTAPVNRKIEEVLGINHEQFKQISMIAQGEFLELLIASSSKRVEIFRNIFGTNIFNRIQGLLIDRSKILYRDIMALRNRMTEAVSAIATGDEQLNEWIRREHLNYPLIVERLSEIIISQREEYTATDSRIQEMNKLYKVLEKDYETQKRWKKQYQQKVHLFTKARQELEDLKEISAQIEAAYKELPQKESLINGIIERLPRIQQQIRELEMLETQEKAVRQCEKALAQWTQALERQVKQKDKQDKKAADLREQLSKYMDLNERKAVLELERATLNNETALLKTILEKCQSHAKLAGDYEQLRTEYLQSEKMSESRREAYEYQESLKRKAAAGILAESLREGIPCPVCGSISHPQLAVMETEVLDDHQIRQLKSAYEKAVESRNQLHTRAVSVFDLMQSVENEVKSMNQIDPEKKQTVKQIERRTVSLIKAKQKELEKITAQYEKLQKDQQKQNDLTTQAEILEKEQAALNENMNHVRQEQDKAHISFNSACQMYDQMKERLGENTADKKELEARRREDDRLLKQLRTEREKILKRYDETRQKILERTAQIDNYSKDIDFLSKELQKADDLVAMDLEHARQTFRVSDEAESEADTEGCLTAMHRTLEQTRKQKERLYSSLNANKRVLSNMKVHMNELKILEDQYGDIKKLEGIARGNNEKKLVFEQYVLGVYFEEILKAANLRLDKMTHGRYVLQKVMKITDMRKTNSLDIEVMDHYTGKVRSVKTLSGGETFKAALALALGLSDMIQRHVGGIEIDALFVDEGFGSLDQESVEQAIEILLGLTGKNRFVGIISHVPELMNRIDHQIVVEKSVSGSSIQIMNKVW